MKLFTPHARILDIDVLNVSAKTNLGLWKLEYAYN